MDMDWYAVVKVIGAVALCALGYVAGVLKVLYNKSEKISEDLAAHRVEVAEKYLPRVELKALEDRLDKRFDRMEQWIGRRFDSIMNRDDSHEK